MSRPASRVIDMTDTRIVHLVQNGASQAVRLPPEFRFEGDRVFATRDPKTGDVLLSARPAPATWDAFFELMETIDVPTDFMSERPGNRLPVDREMFSGE